MSPKRTAVYALKVAIAGAVLAWLFASGKLEPGLLARLLGSPGALALATAAVAVHYFLGALRWWLLIRGQGIAIPLGAAVRLTLIGMFFNTFMPGAVGGDPFKIYYVAEHAPPGKKVEAGTSVFLDRFVGLASMAAIVVATVAVVKIIDPADDAFFEAARHLGERLRPVVRLLVAGAIAGAILIAVFLHPRVRRQGEGGPTIAGRIALSFGRAALTPGATAAAFSVSVLAHAATIFAFVVLGRTLGDDLPAARYGQLVPIGLMIQAIPGPPAGIGVGEAAFEALFAIALRASTSLGGEICAIWHLIVLVHNVAGGVVYVLYRSDGLAAAVAERPAGR